MVALPCSALASTFCHHRKESSKGILWGHCFLPPLFSQHFAELPNALSSCAFRTWMMWCLLGMQMQWLRL